MKWEDPGARETYQYALEQQLHTLAFTSLDQIPSRDAASEIVNKMYSSLAASIHSAAHQASQHGLPEQQQRSVPRRTHWWNHDCSVAKSRMRLFFHIWKSAGRPLQGETYECHRHAKKSYRRVCRLAANSASKSYLQLLTRLHQANRPGQFWNIIRKLRSKQTDHSAITIQQLQSHLQTKFSCPEYDQDLIQQSDQFVTSKYNSIVNLAMQSVTLSERRIMRMIKSLRLGCSPGIDGIQAEHLRYASQESSLPLCLSFILTLCLRFCVVPEIFCTGTLIPILKKPQLDPSSPASYRPITVSVIISKLLELYVLEECSDHDAHPCQYGFVSHRGTNTAISLAHDVSAYCDARGTPTYSCSLDAQGAFDALPHAVIFHKAANVLPDHCWRLMRCWYSDMRVRIKWGNQLSAPIPVKIGTRQGGLSSPFLFNLFYEELINELNNENCGVSIAGQNYNVHCYADDILLMSTTTSGLQRLIDIAVSYINSHGLRFNPTKSSCMTYGKSSPALLQCTIEGEPIPSAAHGTLYLGAVLKDDGGYEHAARRVKAAQKAFYGLQGAGLHFKGIEPCIAAKMFNIGVNTVLTYGCQSVHLATKNMRAIETAQGKLIKSLLGLRKTSRTSPLLDALNVVPVRETIAVSSMTTLRSSLLHSSHAKNFYTFLMCQQTMKTTKTLVNRALTCAQETDVDFNQFLFNDSYFKQKRRVSHVFNDGVVDSIKGLLFDYSAENRDMVQLLVNTF